VAASRAEAEEQKGGGNGEEGGGSGRAHTKREGGGSGQGRQPPGMRGTGTTGKQCRTEQGASRQHGATRDREKEGVAGGVAACEWVTAGPWHGGRLWVAAG
jgi:hypothetical protein